MTLKEIIKYIALRDSLSGKEIKELRETLSAKLWPLSTPGTRGANMTNLVLNKTKMHSQKTIIICEHFGISPNDLYNYNKETKSFNHEKVV